MELLAKFFVFFFCVKHVIPMNQLIIDLITGCLDVTVSSWILASFTLGQKTVKEETTFYPADAHSDRVFLVTW